MCYKFYLANIYIRYCKISSIYHINVDICYDAGAGGCSSCKESKQTKIIDGSTASMVPALFFLALMWKNKFCESKTQTMKHTEDWFLTICSSFILPQENHDALIKSLIEDRRFDDKKSAAACIVYKSLLHWHSFEAEKTNIFDRIIQTIRSSVEVAIHIAYHLTFSLK